MMHILLHSYMKIPETSLWADRWFLCGEHEHNDSTDI